jgi:hypothetical protein
VTALGLGGGAARAAAVDSRPEAVLRASDLNRYVVVVKREKNAPTTMARWTAQVADGQSIVAAFWGPTRRWAVRQAEARIRHALEADGRLTHDGYAYRYPGTARTR